jgi:hypothetical protein
MIVSPAPVGERIIAERPMSTTVIRRTTIIRHEPEVVYNGGLAPVGEQLAQPNAGTAVGTVVGNVVMAPFRLIAAPFQALANRNAEPAPVGERVTRITTYRSDSGRCLAPVGEKIVTTRVTRVSDCPAY